MLPTFRPSASEADRAKLYTSMAELERQGRLGQKQLSNLASEVPGTRRPGQTGHYRNTIFPDASELTASPKPQTLFELVRQVTDEIPNEPALAYLPTVSPPGVKPALYADSYQTVTYGELEQARMEVGSALMHLYRSGILGSPDSIERIDPRPVGPEQGWSVGIWSGNRPEWQMTDMATQAFGLVSVALYDTLGPNTTVYVSNHAQLPIILCTLAHLAELLAILPECPTVKAVVCMDALVGPSKTLAHDWAKSKGVALWDWEGFRALGREHRIEAMPPRPENVATLCYTSGTTGNPKGAILTHRSMTTAVIANAYGCNFPLKGTVMISYLPLAHVYGRFLDLLIVLLRGVAGYSTGDPVRLLADVQLLRPHFFPSVPRALNKIYAAIAAQASAPGLKGKLLRHAIDTKIANFRETGAVTHPVYDRLVFSKVQKIMGGRLLYHTSGSAPIAKEVFETLKVAFAVDSIEGWGMTETVGTGAQGWPNDPGATGTIGAPRIINEFKLVDVPEMGYLSTDSPMPRGELCVKGANVFSGYYKDEKNTKEALDDEGWLHTGDVCAVDSAGRFKIIDRKKNLVKLQQGEYVAVETVENIYMVSPLFSAFYLHADSLKNHLVAIGVVDPAQMLAFLAQRRARWPNVKTEADVARLVNDGGKEGRRLRQEVVESLMAHGRAKKLNGYELVKGIHLTMDPFPADLLTPSFKYKRQAVKKTFAAELERAYDESDEVVAVPAKL